MNNDSKDFLIKEYERISEAHFNTSSQISLFFRYYLTLMSVPAFLLLYIDKDIKTLVAIFSGSPEFFLKPHLGTLCILISVIGIGLTIFLIKLKFEHILYARTVNGIRQYFNNNDTTLISFLVLPIDMKKPSYTGLGFGSLVFVNALVNSSYLSFGLYLLNVKCHLIFGIMLIIFHIGGYFLASYFEEKGTP